MPAKGPGEERHSADRREPFAIADNLIPFGYRREWPAYRAWDHFYWARLVAFLNRCDAVTSPTQAACDLLRAHGLVRPAVPISNGVDLSVFRPPLPGEKARLRAGFGLPADRPVVLYAGRLAREKGLDVLLAAMPLVLARVPCHFLVVGAGDLDFGAMAARAGLSADITLTGLLSDARVAEAYRAADVLVAPLPRANCRASSCWRARRAACRSWARTPWRSPRSSATVTTGFFMRRGARGNSPAPWWHWPGMRNAANDSPPPASPSFSAMPLQRARHRWKRSTGPRSALVPVHPRPGDDVNQSIEGFLGC